jgi:hypothetical protein
MLAALLTVFLSFQEVEEPNLPDAEIVKMGRNKWFDLYTSKVGNSTAAMCGAEHRFGAALKGVNDAKLRTATDARRQTVNLLRPELAEYRTALVELGSVFSGGGTIWNPVYAGTEADVEETIALILDPKGKAKAQWVVSKVTKRLDSLRTTLRRRQKDVDDSKDITGGYARGMKCLSNAETRLKATVLLLRKESRRVSDLVLEYLHDQTKIPLGMGG